MLNVGGGELLVIALVALIALGPEQLPSVMRKLGALSAQVRSITSDLKDEFLSGLDDSGPGQRSSSRPPGRFDPNEPIVPRGYAQRRAMEQAMEADAAADPAPGDGAAPPIGATVPLGDPEAPARPAEAVQPPASAGDGDGDRPAHPDHRS